MAVGPLVAMDMIAEPLSCFLLIGLGREGGWKEWNDEQQWESGGGAFSGRFRRSRAAQPGQGGVFRPHNAYPASLLHTSFVPVQAGRALGASAPSAQGPPSLDRLSPSDKADQKRDAGGTASGRSGQSYAARRNNSSIGYESRPLACTPLSISRTLAIFSAISTTSIWSE